MRFAMSSMAIASGTTFSFVKSSSSWITSALVVRVPAHFFFASAMRFF